VTSWTDPRDWTDGELVTASIGNIHWRNNLKNLKETKHGILVADWTPSSNIGVGETVLHSYVLPGATLSADNMIARFTFAGTIAANANQKILKFKFGGAIVTVFNVTASGSNWRAVVDVIRSGGTAQKIGGQWSLRAAGSPDGGGLYTTGGETMSSSITVQVTGQSDTASTDITKELFFGELLGPAS
jgi:hypothetical protein